MTNKIYIKNVDFLDILKKLTKFMNKENIDLVFIVLYDEKESILKLFPMYHKILEIVVYEGLKKTPSLFVEKDIKELKELVYKEVEKFITYLKDLLANYVKLPNDFDINNIKQLDNDIEKYLKKVQEDIKRKLSYSS